MQEEAHSVILLKCRSGRDYVASSAPNLPKPSHLIWNKAKGLPLRFLDFPHSSPSWPVSHSLPPCHMLLALRPSGPPALRGSWTCHSRHMALTLAPPSGQKALELDSHQLSHLLQIFLASALDLPVLHPCSVSPHGMCPWNDHITFYLAFLSPFPHLTMAPHNGDVCLFCLLTWHQHP